MNPGDLSNNQLLQLIALFIGLALMFVGLIGFLFMGGLRRSKHNQKKAGGLQFKGDLLQGAKQTEAPPPDLNQPWDVNEIGPTFQTEETTAPPTKKEGLLKSGGLLKNPDQPLAPPKEATANTNAGLLTTRLNQPSPPTFTDETPISMTEEAPSDRLTTNRQELLRVLVDQDTGQIVVDVDGQSYDHIRQVKEQETGQRILEVLALLLKFSGGAVATKSGLKTLPVPNAVLTSLPPKPVPPKVATRQETGKPMSETPPTLMDVVQPPPSYREPVSRSGTPEPPHNPSWRLFGFGSKAKDGADLSGFNLADEIDTVVQQRLADEGVHTPVKISTGLDGLLRIDVAGRVFDSIDAVEPPHIRAMMQAAIKAWEGR